METRDNDRPDVAAPVKTKLNTLKSKVVPHPLYSLVIAPSLQHCLVAQHFSNFDEVKNLIDSWIDAKSVDFFSAKVP